jgi:hypothetical protein
VTCGGCLRGPGETTLFFLPGAWEGALCESCAMVDPVIAARFRGHYGEVRRVSDGDAGKGQAKA